MKKQHVGKHLIYYYDSKEGKLSYKIKSHREIDKKMHERAKIHCIFL